MLTKKVRIIIFAGIMISSALNAGTKIGTDQSRLTASVASNTADIAALEAIATPTRQTIYDQAASGQESTELDSGGYSRYLYTASTTEIFKINNDDLTVYCYNLGVLGTQTTINTTTVETDEISILPPLLDGVPLSIEPSSGGPMTANAIEYRTTAATSTIAFKVGPAGKVNDVKIDSRVRSADLSFWKKDACAVGDVFGWFKCPEDMTITKLNASAVTAPTGSALSFAVNIRTVGGSLASVTSSVVSISATNTESSEVSSFTDATWPKGSIIQLIVTAVGSTVAGSDLIVAIEGTYDD